MTGLPNPAQASSDDLETTPFAHVLIELLDARRTGTLLVYAADEGLHAAIRIEAGRPKAVLAAEGGERRVTDILMPLCAWIEGRLEFLDGQDLVGTDGLVAAGPIDPVPMIAAAARTSLREDVVSQSMGLISRSLIATRPGVDFRRYAFTAEERLVVRCIEQEPLALEELRARVDVPAQVLRRVLYVLRITRGIALIPLQRAVSGTITHAPPLAGTSAPVRAPTQRPVVSQRPTATPSQRFVQSQHPSVAQSQRPTQRPSAVPSQRPSAVPSQRPSAVPSQRPTYASTRELPFGALDLDLPEPPLSSVGTPTDERALRQRAEVLWQQAERLSMRSQHDAALRTAQSALKLGNTPPEREALLGWLIYRHDGEATTANPHVWKCLNHALKRDPLCEEALFYKGLVLSRTGEPDQAEAHFQRVLMLNPKHVEAAREARIHEMRRSHQRQQSGFLRRLLTDRPGSKTGA
jgi:hypothetical protein